MIKFDFVLNSSLESTCQRTKVSLELSFSQENDKIHIKSKHLKNNKMFWKLLLTTTHVIRPRVSTLFLVLAICESYGTSNI